jgi:hypothetical protein
VTKPKIARIKNKGSKVSKKLALDSIIVVKQEIAEGMEVEARNAQLIEHLDEDPLGLEAENPVETMESDALCIHEVSDDNKSEAEYSDSDTEKVPDSADLEAEIRNINQHLCGKLESMISYHKDKPWKRYIADAEITLKLNLKMIEKIYYFNQGLDKQCTSVTLTSPIDFEGVKIKNMLEGLQNPTNMTQKFSGMEKKLELLYSQISKNTNGIKTMAKEAANKPTIKTVQAAQDVLAKDLRDLKENRPDLGPQVTIKNLQDIVEELEKSLEKNCIDRSTSKYPFGYNVNLERLARKDSDLSPAEIQECIQAAVSFADPIVAVVIFDMMGFKLKDPTGGKIMSEFSKNLVVPLCLKDPEQRIKQKSQFHRIMNSWDKILGNLINPGAICASGIIEECKIAFRACKDGCMDKHPVGIRIKGLGLSCLGLESQLPPNGAVLEKIFELKPQLLTSLKASYEPWPKNRASWSQAMRNWYKDQLPLGKPLRYVDIANPLDYITTPNGQKEFAYQNGNKYLQTKYPKTKFENKEIKPKSGVTGINIWEICRKNSVNLK